MTSRVVRLMARWLSSFVPRKIFFYAAYLRKEGEDIVHRVEKVSRGCLIRKDFYSYTKMFTEYYTPVDNKAHLYQRRFFNEDGSVAYDEIVDGKDSVFRFPDKILSSNMNYRLLHVATWSN